MKKEGHVNVHNFFVIFDQIVFCNLCTKNYAGRYKNKTGAFNYSLQFKVKLFHKEFMIFWLLIYEL